MTTVENILFRPVNPHLVGILVNDFEALRRVDVLDKDGKI